jgi:ATP-dependent DNA ligase
MAPSWGTAQGPRLRRPRTSSRTGIVLAGVVESGYGRDVVEQLPRLTRQEVRRLESLGAVWRESPPLTGDVKYLEWSAAGGLRHASLVSWGNGS